MCFKCLTAEQSFMALFLLFSHALSVQWLQIYPKWRCFFPEKRTHLFRFKTSSKVKLKLRDNMLRKMTCFTFKTHKDYTLHILGLSRILAFIITANKLRKMTTCLRLRDSRSLHIHFGLVISLILSLWLLSEMCLPTRLLKRCLICSETIVLPLNSSLNLLIYSLLQDRWEACSYRRQKRSTKHIWSSQRTIWKKHNIELKCNILSMHLCPEMHANEIQCSSWINIASVFFTLLRVWQNVVCFGDFWGKKALCDAYHKKHTSQSLTCISGHISSVIY